jgi:hypothetical protein
MLARLSAAPVSKILDNSILHSILQSQVLQKPWRLNENHSRLKQWKAVVKVNLFVV